MYWLGPIRYARWIAAMAILAVGLFAEFRPSSSVDYPFAAEATSRGSPVTAIDWRQIPAGLLPSAAQPGAIAAVDIEAGQPLLASLTIVAEPIPRGWWSIPVAMRFETPIGARLQLVDNDSGRITEGIVVAGPPDDPFAIDPAALVAVPPEHAAAFAVAAAAGRVTALVAAD